MADYSDLLRLSSTNSKHVAEATSVHQSLLGTTVGGLGLFDGPEPEEESRAGVRLSGTISRRTESLGCIAYLASSEHRQDFLIRG